MLKKSYYTYIVCSHEKKDRRFVSFHYYCKMLGYICKFYHTLNTIKSNLEQYDLLEHVKDNTLIIICHYSVCVIYDLYKAVNLLKVPMHQNF